MGPGAVRYFTRLAREDYYTRGGEPPGRWLGAGARALGLVDEVEADELKNLFQGYSPLGVKKLVQSAGRTRVDGRQAHHPGWDATFSAPKSVSVLWSQAAPELRSKIQDAHFSAVADAVGYLEKKVAYTRRGKGGEVIEPAVGLVAAAYEHGTSRAQDPQLHTHCLIFNVAPRHDGTTGTLYGIARRKDGERSFHKLPLYEEKMAAGAIYRASLAAYLSRDADLRIEPRRDFGFEVAGVPEKLIKQFSKRREAIELELEYRALAGAKASEKATLLTREVKAHVAREELFEKWREEGKGFRIRLGRGHRKTTDRASDKVARTAVSKLLERKHVFGERDITQLVAEACLDAGLGADGALKTTNRILEDPKRYGLMPLGPKETEPQYTTAELFELAEVMRNRPKAWQRGARAVPDRDIDEVLASLARPGFKFSDRQTKLLRDITQKRGAERFLSGLSGLERANVLEVARRSWERRGYKVIAATSSRWAEDKLFNATGIESRTSRSLTRATRPKTHKATWRVMVGLGDRGIFFKTLRGFFRYADRVKGRPWMTFDRKTVLVIDDPNRIHVQHLAELTAKVRGAGGTVVYADRHATREQEKAAERERSKQEEPPQTEQAQETQQQRSHGWGRG